MSETKWTQEAVEKYITDQIEEGTSLDYKAAAALSREDKYKAEITKDVSAMANSNGGIVIYGITEKNSVTPDKIDPINRKDFSREWLEQVINTIQPRIQGILIHVVIINGIADDVVYIVEIPQSNTAHQARDKRYWKRYNFQCLMMEDFEIRDVMGRAKHPQISLEIKIKRCYLIKKSRMNFLDSSYDIFPNHSRKEEVVHHCKLEVALKNENSIYANYAFATLMIPQPVLPNDPMQTVENHAVAHELENLVPSNGLKFVPDIIATGQEIRKPILPFQSLIVAYIDLPDVTQSQWDELKLQWKAQADNSPIYFGQILGKSIPDIDLGTLEQEQIF